MTQVHPTAIVEDGAELGDDVEVGPYCLVGPNVRIGDGTRVMGHVVLAGHTTLGRACRVFPFACIGTETQDLKFRGATTHVEIGDSSVLREYVTINSSTDEGEVTRVGSNCFIMAYSHVAHACDVGDEVIMANAATLAGHVKVEDKAIIGGLTAVHQFSHIGTMCMVGGCTRIVEDCLPYMTVAGNPARCVGPNSIGLRRRNVSVEARRLLKQAHRMLCRQGLSTPKAMSEIQSKLEMIPEIEHLVSFVQSTKRGITR